MTCPDSPESCKNAGPHDALPGNEAGVPVLGTWHWETPPPPLSPARRRLHPIRRESARKRTGPFRRLASDALADCSAVCGRVHLATAATAVPPPDRDPRHTCDLLEKATPAFQTNPCLTHRLPSPPISHLPFPPLCDTESDNTKQSPSTYLAPPSSCADDRIDWAAFNLSCVCPPSGIPHLELPQTAARPLALTLCLLRVPDQPCRAGGGAGVGWCRTSSRPVPR